MGRLRSTNSSPSIPAPDEWCCSLPWAPRQTRRFSRLRFRGTIFSWQSIDPKVAWSLDSGSSDGICAWHRRRLRARRIEAPSATMPPAEDAAALERACCPSNRLVDDVLRRYRDDAAKNLAEDRQSGDGIGSGSPAAVLPYEPAVHRCEPAVIVVPRRAISPAKAVEIVQRTGDTPPCRRPRPTPPRGRGTQPRRYKLGYSVEPTMV